MQTILKFASILWIMNVTAALAQNVPAEGPFLQLDVGMHTGRISKMAADATCRWLVTSSDDKTVRLWRLPEANAGQAGEPKMLRTFRVPIGPGVQGQVFAVALSPDRQMIAAGGRDTDSPGGLHGGVYVFDASSGKIIRHFGDLEDVVQFLTFSPNGKNLAVTLAGGAGIKVWNTENWQIVLDDKDYNGDDSPQALYDKQGRLFAAGGDFIRRYGVDLRRELNEKIKTKLLTPWSIAIHEDKIAVGFNESPAVEVYSTDLKFLFPVNLRNVNKGTLSQVAWSADGTLLYSGGAYDLKINQTPLRVWDQGGRGEGKFLNLANSDISQLIPCGSGFAIATANPPAIDVYSAGGRKQTGLVSPIADMREKVGDNFTISNDGLKVRFGSGFGGKQPVLFDLLSQKVELGAVKDSALTGADVRSLDIKNWKDTAKPTLNNKELKIDFDTFSHALAIAPDGLTFVIGTDESLIAYNASSGNQIWNVASESRVFGVNITSNGNLVVAAYGDGTVRWHKLSDGKELLALFVNTRNDHYLVWTPSGYYDGSADASDWVGWHFNHGSENAPDFFKLNSLRAEYRRPDIIKLVLSTLDEDQAIARANSESARKINNEDLRKRLPPVINIVNPVDNSAVTRNIVQITYDLRSPSRLPIKRVRALINNGTGPRPVNVEAKGNFDGIGPEDRRFTISVPVPPSDVDLSLVAETEDNVVGSSLPVHLRWTGTQAPLQPPVLYALIVGVSAYEHSDEIDPLHWAAKDAKDLAEFLETQKGIFYRDVKINLLSDEKAKRGDLVNALAEIQRASSRGDVVIVFFSGHGAVDERQNYYYLPYDAKLNPKAHFFVPLDSTAVRQSDILAAVKDIQGHAFLLLDTCHAGGALGPGHTAMKGSQDLTAFFEDLKVAGNGVIVLSSSSRNELSQECDCWKNGAFTKAIVEGLRGKADHGADNVITFDKLVSYVDKTVKELTENHQHPEWGTPEGMTSIAVGIARVPESEREATAK